jgi:two-component system response regulator RpfG
MGMVEEDLRTVTISAILHDIGKFAVSESILDKPGPLTEDEMAVVRTHPVVGANILSGIPSYETIMPGVMHHHERWNGSGYPDGLSGADISLNGRILAIADVYDAITDERPYRRGWGVEEAARFMRAQKEAMFDPGLVDLFLMILADMDYLDEIRERRKILG